jgi:hypothetical protein
MCAGYESGVWRCEQLASHMLLDWIMDYVLPPDLHSQVGVPTGGRQFSQACKVIYSSKKYEKRGEFGELLLHAVLRQEYKTEAAISKIYLKSSADETVKGFDVVHVAATSAGLELWLGEAKFYSRIKRAIADVVAELHRHLLNDYLRKEFIFVSNRLPRDGVHSASLKRLLHPNVSLDEVFKRIRIPVLLTYDSKCINSHSEICANFEASLEQETRAIHSDFVSAILPKVSIHLILLPLARKRDLVDALDTKLKAAQSI